MKSKKIITITLVIGVFASLSIYAYSVVKESAIDDLPGDVIGSNPDGIPESQLPVCSFTGAEFVQQPCYSPPGSLYL